MKTFNYVRIELGIIEADNIEEAQEILDHGNGANIGHSTDKLFEPDDDPKFWGNLMVESVEVMKKELGICNVPY